MSCKSCTLPLTEGRNLWFRGGVESTLLKLNSSVNIFAFEDSMLLIIWSLPEKLWVSMAIRFSCKFFWISASCFFTQTSLNPSIKIFPIKAIEPKVITPSEARIVFLFGDWIIEKILWWISSFIQWFLVIPGRRYSLDDSNLPLENFFIIAVNPPNSPITLTVIPQIG